MCIRDSSSSASDIGARSISGKPNEIPQKSVEPVPVYSSTCLLYTSDAADDLLCVDLGGRRIITKKKLEMT